MFVFVSHRVFLFTQKTAYEMRSSDWSSDVCSSDLHVFAALLVCVFIPIGVDAQQDERLASLYEQASETSGLVVQYENDVRATLTNQQLTRDYKPTWKFYDLN